jgi:hypothetical protein
MVTTSEQSAANGRTPPECPPFANQIWLGLLHLLHCAGQTAGRAAAGLQETGGSNFAGRQETLFPGLALSLDKNKAKRGGVMRILLAAMVVSMMVAPCLAASDNQSEDKSPADALTPGVNEPRTPDTLKSAPDQRIQNEGRASERAQDRTVGEKGRPLDQKRDDERK